METSKSYSIARETRLNYKQEISNAAKIIEATRETAQEATSKALDEETARLRAEEETRAVRQEIERAEQNKARAEEQARQSQNELDELQTRRKQELDKMYEGLGRIAKTRRTASGMVVELTSDSFYFEFDKAALSPANREVLSRIAGVLLVSNGYGLSIHGHTDDVGTGEYNRHLSERRAAAVGDYLKSAGIDPAVIETKGFGKSSPRVEGTSRDARQKNRRVEIAIVDSIIQYREVVANTGKS
jgi:outer membrane protein OmpA-like peptidoglycan-associated protein